MDAVDRLGWTDGMTIRVAGVHVGFRTDVAGALDGFWPRLPPGWVRTDREKVRRLYSLRVGGPGRGRGNKRFHVLFMNASRLERSLDLDYVLDRLEADVQLYVAERARARIFVHAGVVGWNGRALVLPGSTLSGKSTLVQELLRLGATYYSDEYAVLDAKGRVHPFPRLLSLRRPGADPNERPARRTAEELGAQVGRKPLPVGLVALVRYRSGARWRATALSPGKGLIALLENTVPARSRPRASLEALRRVVSSAPVLTGTRGEAQAAAAALLARLG